MASRKILLKLGSRVFSLLLVLALLLVEGSWKPAHSQGGFGITPHRVVFEGRERRAKVTMMNRSAKPVTYRVVFRNKRMNEDGKFVVVKDVQPEDKFADKYIRYSPRQIIIPANSSQTVRLSARKPRDLAPGEYLSRLVFEALPPPGAGTDVEQVQTTDGGLAIRMITRFSISIPVILRQGDLSATASLSELKLQSEVAPKVPASLSLNINRQGNRSVFGDIIVTFIPQSGETLEVGVMRGLSVYATQDIRTFNIRLRPPEGVQLKSGRLHVTFMEASVDNKNPAVLAEGQITLP